MAALLLLPGAGPLAGVVSATSTPDCPFILRSEEGRHSLWTDAGGVPVCLSGGAHVRGNPATDGTRVAWIGEKDLIASVHLFNGTETVTLVEAPRGRLENVALGKYGVAWSQFVHDDWDVVVHHAGVAQVFGDTGYDDVLPVVGDTGIAWIRSWGVDVTVRSTLGRKSAPVRLPGDFVEELAAVGDQLAWTVRRDREEIVWFYDQGSSRQVLEGRAALERHFNNTGKIALPPSASPSEENWPVIWRKLEPRQPPVPRTTHATVQIDGGRVLIFGGEIIDPRTMRPVGLGNDTWILDASKTVWTRAGGGPAPSPRCHIPMAFDPKRKVALLWGGAALNPEGQFHTLGDTWLFDTAASAWKEAHPATKPSPGVFANDTGLDYDSRGDRFIMYFRGAIWAFNADQLEWTPINVEPGPSPRCAFSMVFDPTGNQLLFYGGNVHPFYMDDTWLLDLNTGKWREILAAARPPARARPALAYDARHRRAILYGGVRGPASDRFADLWAFDFNKEEWKLIREKDPASPGPRGGFMGVACDPANDLITLFAGRSAFKGFHRDTWTLKVGN